MIQPDQLNVPISPDMRYYRDWLLLSLAAAACLVAPTRATAIEPDEPVRVTLRAEWSAPASGCDGTIQLSAGRVISSRLLVTHGDDCRLVSASDDSVQFHADRPLSWGGLAIVVEAPLTASITMRVAGAQVETRLSELLDGSTVRADGDGWVRLRRDVADMLRVKIDRPHLVFAPGEEARVAVEFNLLAEQARSVATHLSLELRPARSAQRLFARQAELQIPTNAAVPLRRELQVRMPNNEGAYDLVLHVEPEAMKPVERVVQFVVVDSSAASQRPNELVTRLVAEIDPTQPEVQGAWYSRQRLMARTSRLGHFLWRSVRHPFSSTEPGNDSPSIASRIRVDNAGRPHVLGIDYDPNATALVTASISEQDADGRWIAPPQTGGIKLTEKPQATGIQSHQLVFWPRTNSPTLSLNIVGSGGVSAVKKVRVLELPQGFPALELNEPESAKRLLGLSIDNPDAWSGWGSSRVVDAATGLVVDDWQTFLASAEHVAEYARFAGFNCVQATVVSHGSAMYPTQLLDANYRLDSGSLAESAPDPMRKDVVELLLRTCERAEIGLVPSLRLDGMIAALEAKLGASDPRNSGIALVSREGKTWEQQSAPAATRRYNPLNPAVQSAIVDVVREFAERYATRPGLKSLALDLGPQTHLVLPGADWGYDDVTVEKFLRDTSLDVLPLGDSDPGRFARRHQVLNGAAREQWIAWRGRQLTALVQSVLAELERVRPDARLVLNLTTFVGPGGEDLREALRSARSVEDVLRVRGIDLRSWSTLGGIVVLRPYLASEATAEAQQLNSSRELDDLTSKVAGHGTLCVHEPEVLYVSGDGQKSGDVAETITVPLASPGRANLRWLAHSLAAADCQAFFEGGPAVAFGQEQYQREFARVFRSLPAAEFRAVETLQPVAVRSHHDLRDTYVYLVNDASYSVETNLSFTCPSKAQLTNGSTGDKLTTQPTEQGLGAKLTLEPFQTIALRLSGPEAVLSPCSVKVPLVAEKSLKVRFDRLKQAMAILGRDASRTLDGLPPNGEFEQAADDGNAPARWTADGDSASSVLDRSVFHKGAGSLRLKGHATDGVSSDSFAAPAGRAIALNVWVRADRPGLKVRWFLEGKHGDETIYRCYADVPVHTNWEQKQFRARDLPDGQLTDVQIRFQLLGDGSLWIDDAEVCALPISKDEQRAITKSVSAIFKAWTDRRLSDFERMADGYWATYLIESVEGSNEQPGKPPGSEPPM